MKQSKKELSLTKRILDALKNKEIYEKLSGEMDKNMKKSRINPGLKKE